MRIYIISRVSGGPESPIAGARPIELKNDLGDIISEWTLKTTPEKLLKLSGKAIIVSETHYATYPYELKIYDDYIE